MHDLESQHSEFSRENLQTQSGNAICSESVQVSAHKYVRRTYTHAHTLTTKNESRLTDNS